LDLPDKIQLDHQIIERVYLSFATTPLVGFFWVLSFSSGFPHVLS